MHATRVIHLTFLIISDVHVTRSDSPIRQVDICLWPRVCCKHLTGIFAYLLSNGSFRGIENGRRASQKTDY